MCCRSSPPGSHNDRTPNRARCVLQLAGLPGRHLERYFKTGTLSPEETLTALADFAPAASFGEQFIYNNLLVAAGRYAAGVAARGDGAGDVGFAYDAALQQRVLSPIGMKRSTRRVRTRSATARRRPWSS
jgi:CubicO group peptidase (beta-lactamase class C family)